MDTIGKKLVNINWIDFIILLMGIVLITEFYTLLAVGFFSPQGMTKYITYLVENNNALWWNPILTFAGQHSYLFSPLCAFFILGTAIMLVLLLFRSIASLIAACIFFVYYVSHLAAPATWLYEYIIPTLICICIGLARLPDLLLIHNHHRIFGFKIYGQFRLLPRFFILVIVSVLLWYIVLLSNNAGQLSNRVGIASAVTFAILSVISTVLDKFRANYLHLTHIDVKKFKRRHRFLYKLHEQPWLDIITIIIGSMLVFQVFEDHLLNWFTLTGYSDLAELYRHYTHAPLLISYFLNFAQDFAKFFMPVQLVVESTCALLLIVLIFREPFIFFAAVLFVLLSFSEFGVPATWPPTPTSIPTWTWELLLTTIVAFFVSFYQLGRLMMARDHKERWLGNNVFGKTRFITRFIVAVLAGLLLACVIILNREVKQYNHILAIESGLQLFFFIMILAAVDYVRPPYAVLIRRYLDKSQKYFH